MKKLNLLLAFLLLALSFASAAKSPPAGTGVADVPANILIMLDTSGSMGASTNSSTRLYYPTDTTVDSKGNVFVLEGYYHRIKKYDSSGNLLKTIGGYGRPNGRFRNPLKIDIDASDNIYISDYSNARVQKLDNSGNWLKSFTGLSFPQGVTVDTNGNVYASSSSTIRKWHSNGNWAGHWTASYINGLSAYDGHLYAVSHRLRKVYKFLDIGGLQTSWATSNNARPYDVEANSNGVYVANVYHYVQKYSNSGVYDTQWGGYGSGNSNFRYVYGIGSDSSGNIYAADLYNHSIKKFDSNGTYISTPAGGDSDSRLSQAKKVIKKLMRDSDINKGANFGFMEWATYAPKVNIPISSKGAARIENEIDSFSACTSPAGCGTYVGRAMKTAQGYLNSMGSKPSCQKTYVLLISDGAWYGHSSAKNIVTTLKNQGIKTFVIGFHLDTNNTTAKNNYKDMAEAGGTYPDSPIYTDNWQYLYTTLSNYIRQAISSRFTASAPVIMPDIKSGDFLFQSTFEYIKDHQWKGELTKYKINTDGSIGNSVWEAGKKLDAKSESDRQIWTIANNIGIDTSLNNFTTSNLSGLKNLIWYNSGKSPTDNEGTDLINFVRGLDAYDEDSDGNTTEKRWKLGDIYHSQLAVVGSPSAKTTSDKNKSNTEAYYRYQQGYDSFKGGNRKEVVYVGANDGMLHAFDSNTGDELWAFIPPTMLQSLSKMDSVKANTSHSIYGVDGSPVVKDIYYANKWRSVLLSGMGSGGFGYFALDVTKPGTPIFLFAFQNNPTEKTIYHWNADGDRKELGYAVGIPSEFDYSKLGETWSTPVIMAMPYDSTTKSSNTDKRRWVAVFGAGYNGSVATDYGSAVYVIDMEDEGKVLKRIDLSESVDSNGSIINNNIANSVPATLTAITPDTTSKANYKGGMFYFADLEGKFWKLNLTNTGSLYEITQVFDAEATHANDRMSFFSVRPSIGNDGKLWMYYGTGNQQKLQRISTDIANRIYGFKDEDFPVFKKISKRSINKDLNNTTNGGMCPTSANLGWYVDLDKHEKVTGELTVMNEIVSAPRYTPKTDNICKPGASKLTEHNYACGNTLRSTNLGEGIATGMVIYKGKGYIGITGDGTGDIKDKDGEVIGKRKDNLIMITPLSGNSKAKGSVTYESWREVF